MKVKTRRTLWILLATTLIALSFRYTTHSQYQLRNFGLVREGVLYRSGQPTPSGLKQFLQEHNIRTLVSLRGEHEPDSNTSNTDIWEEEMCKQHGVNYIRLIPNKTAENWLDKMAVGFMSVMDDPTNYPVLVHCFAGRDRTGTMCAIYRMEYEGWSSSLAATEMSQFGFDPAKDPIAKSYEQYVLKYRTRKQRLEQ